MKRRNLLAVAIIAYGVALIVTAPASLVDAALKDASTGRLRLADAHGTLWAGTGQIEVRTPDGRSGIARSLSWHLRPASLLRGRLTCEIRLGEASRRFPLMLSLSRVELADAEVILPAAVLGLGVPRLAPLGLTGDVRIRVEHLEFSRAGIEGLATLEWHAAGSTLTPVSPLGDYEVRIDGRGTTLHALLRTMEGPLQLEGKGSWSRSTGREFVAVAEVPPRHREQLSPLLRLIAIERSSGRFDLQFN